MMSNNVNTIPYKTQWRHNKRMQQSIDEEEALRKKIGRIQQTSNNDFTCNNDEILASGSIVTESSSTSSDNLNNMNQAKQQNNTSEKHLQLVFMDSSPLYELNQQNKPITVGTFHLKLLEYISKHNPTMVAITDLLEFFQQILPPSNQAVHNLNLFKQLLTPQDYKVVPYCRQCFNVLNDKECWCSNCFQQSGVKVFKNRGGSKAEENVSGTPHTYFVKLNIKQQLQEWLSDPQNRKRLEYRETRHKEPNTLSDIFDGAAYQELTSSGVIDKHTITVNWNTDGAQTFKSSGKSLWPIYLMINELAPTERVKFENMLVPALYMDDQKPEMLHYLKPWLEDMRDLGTTGIPVSLENGTVVFYRVILLAGVLDTIARAMVLNMKQFNALGGDGSYGGCARCQHCGDRPNGLNKTVFLCKDDTPATRNFQTIKTAVTTNTNIDTSIKGPNALFILQYYDFILNVPIDTMHCCWSGVTKLFLKLWFDAKYRSASFSKRDQLPKFDKNLTCCKLSQEYKRNFRSFEQHGHFWKASEFRSFCLFASSSVLQNILEPIYYNHWMLFVRSMWTLSAKSIPTSKLPEVEANLSLFVKQTETLYGPEFMLFNVHQCSHIMQDVRNFGPIWTHNCFAFENANQMLLNMCHGNTNFLEQILTGIKIKTTIDRVKRMLKKPPTILIASTSTRAEATLYFQGQKDIQELSDVESNFITEYAILTNRNVKRLTSVHKYTRLLDVLGMKKYHTWSYDSDKRTMNCVVALSNPKLHFSIIEGFYDVCYESLQKRNLHLYLAKVRPLTVNPFDPQMTGAYQVVESQASLQYVDISQIKRKVIYLQPSARTPWTLLDFQETPTQTQFTPTP